MGKSLVKSQQVQKMLKWRSHKLIAKMVLKAQIFVTAKDTGAVQTYVVQFQEESPQIQRLELRLPEGQELKEDQTVPLEVIAHYQDGSQASLKADQIDVKTRAGSQGKSSRKQ